MKLNSSTMLPAPEKIRYVLLENLTYFQSETFGSSSCVDIFEVLKKMNNWREIKKQIIAIRSILRSKEVTSDDKKRMERSIEELQTSMEFSDSAVFRDEILLRRDFLTKNPGLLDIFNTFWFISTAYIGQDGTLSKEGYLKIMYSIQVALCGFKSFDDIAESLEFDYLFDSKLFGPLTRASFYDVLFEVIETWSEIVDKNYLAAFSWALLDSVVDITTSPPRLKYIRDVVCIMKISNAADMVTKYFTNKKIRASLTITSEFIQRVPEVQRRLRSRKLARQISEQSLNIMEVLHSHGGSSIHMFSDSEDELSVQSRHRSIHLTRLDVSAVTADGGTNTTRELVKPITGMSSERSDAMIGLPSSRNGFYRSNSNHTFAESHLEPVDDDDRSHNSDSHSLRDDISVNSSLSRQSSLRNTMRQRFNTMSFLEYLKARRNARQILNGDAFSSAGSSATHSRCGVLSTYSMDVDMLPLSTLQEVQKTDSHHSALSHQSQKQQQSLQMQQQQKETPIIAQQRDELVSILPSVHSETPVLFSDSLVSGPRSLEEQPKFLRPSTATNTQMSESLDVIGNRLKSSQNATDGKNKKSAFPMKNVVIDVSMVINNGLKQQQKTTTKPKYDPNISIRNGFNAEMGMTVKSINVSMAGGHVSGADAQKSQTAFHFQESPPSAVIMNAYVAPISEASVALDELAALKKNRQKGESFSVNGSSDLKSGSSETKTMTSRLNNDLLVMTRDLDSDDEGSHGSVNRKNKSDLKVNSASEGMVINDEDSQTPVNQAIRDNEKFYPTLREDADADSITRTIDTEGSEQNSLASSPLSQRMPSPVRLRSATLADNNNEERSLSPPKTAQLTPYRNILGPYPSAYFLSSGESIDDAIYAHDQVSLAQLTQLEDDISVEGRRRSFSTMFTDSSNQLQSAHTGMEAQLKENVNLARNQPQIQIPTALQSNFQTQSSSSNSPVVTGDGSILHVITTNNSRGIFKGLALGDRSHPTTEPSRQWLSAPNQSTNSTSFVSLESNTQELQDESLNKSYSYKSLPALSYLGGRGSERNLQSAVKGGRSMPSLLIKPVTSVRKTGKQTARRGLINKVAMGGDSSPEQQVLAQGQVSVIDSSVKSLTMLSASEFEHLKNSIELSVGGVNHQSLNHIHPYNSVTENSGNYNATSTYYSAKRHPQMTLQSVGHSPVKYECHQSFLNISGSQDIPGNKNNSNSVVNNRSVFSNTGSNALNSAASQFENVGYNSIHAEVSESSDIHRHPSQHSSQFYPKSEFSHAPWIPAELALPADHHRSNRILGWKEKLETLKNFPIVPAKAATTIRNQDAVRVSFEEFVRASPKKMGHYSVIAKT